MKLDELWYGNNTLSLFLIPLSWVFCATVKLRRMAYRFKLLHAHHVSAPVVIVGNITVGGAGKTPLVIWLAEFFLRHGLRPGIVSRGYKGQAGVWPQEVTAASDPLQVGDEPVIIARRTACPVAVAPGRAAAAKFLLARHTCDIILSDDGLQHYALHRDVEIAVVDDIRRFGNGYCLPAGPLREPEERLKTVDFVVTKGAAMPHEICMKHQFGPLRLIRDENVMQPLLNLRGRLIHAVAGVSDPERFFRRLEELGIKIRRHPFPDHYAFKTEDICFQDQLPVVMTEKDAVKCLHIADERHWFLTMDVQLPSQFGEKLLKLLYPSKEKDDG